jgi:TolB-like protein/Tfp pilus assembly protein PilF
MTEGDADSKAGGGPPPVFISYASADAAHATALVHALERNDIKCWIAPRDVKAGALYADAIVRAISSAKALILVLSERAIASSHVSKEIERASSKKCPIIALRIDAAALSPAFEYFLGESQWIEAQSHTKEFAYARLMDAVREPERVSSRPNTLSIPMAPGGTTTNRKPIRDADTLAFDRVKRIPKLDYFVDAFVSALPIRRTGVSTRWTSRRWLWAGVTAAALIVTAAIVLLRIRPDLHSSAAMSTASPAETAAPGLSTPSRSVAVFGFSNLTGDPKEDYFSAGISDELVDSLTRIDQLHVRRGPSLSSHGASVDVSAAAHKLNVANILQGSVRKSGTHVRIAVQLIDASSGDHLWSHIYDREMKDVLDLQVEIAERVASTLNVTLLGDVRQHLAEGGTTNPDAFDAYLRARFAESAQDRAGLRSGLDALDEAIQLDPKYANAYAFRANLLGQLAGEWATSSNELEDLVDHARAAAQKGVALAPNSAQAHLQLAIVMGAFGFDFRATTAEFRKAAQLEPGNSLVQVRFAEWASQFGQEEALEAIHRGVGRNPKNASGMSNLGLVLFNLRHFDEARYFLRTSADQTHNPVMRSQAGLNELALGAPEEALKYCQDRTFNYELLCMAIACHKIGRQQEAQDMLALMTKAQGEKGAYSYAQVYASWGDRDRALKWLEKAMDLKDSGLSFIVNDPFLDSLRQEPRFKQVLTRLDLPPKEGTSP